jgi:sugar fermentation stimulation protein A
MKFNETLQEGILIERYKRFLADIKTASGELVTLHCPNTGSMKNCKTPGSRVWYSTSDNPKRKYPHTWEVVETEQRHLVGINTNLANALVSESIESGLITELSGYSEIKKEVPYGNEKSRVDLLLCNNVDPKIPDCYVEVKNVSLGTEEGLGLFPDAVTTRGQKHLRELIDMKAGGNRAALVFCVQHTGINRLEPADSIDPDYGKLLRVAKTKGVELLAYRAQITSEEITLVGNIPVHLPDLS